MYKVHPHTRTPKIICLLRSDISFKQIFLINFKIKAANGASGALFFQSLGGGGGELYWEGGSIKGRKYGM